MSTCGLRRAIGGRWVDRISRVFARSSHCVLIHPAHQDTWTEPEARPIRLTHHDIRTELGKIAPLGIVRGPVGRWRCRRASDVQSGRIGLIDSPKFASLARPRPCETDCVGTRFSRTESTRIWPGGKLWYPNPRPALVKRGVRVVTNVERGMRWTRRCH